MNDHDAQSRLQALQDESNSLAVKPATLQQIQQVLRLSIQHHDDIDPYILDLEIDRLQALEKSCAGDGTDADQTVQLRLSHLDIFDLEKTCLAAEAHHTALGGIEKLKMSPEELTQLTKEIGRLRQEYFSQQKSVGV